MSRRFGNDAEVNYFSVESPEAHAQHGQLVAEIEARGLLYPVTVINGVPFYDGAVSYPAILRAINNKLLEAQEGSPAQ